VLAKTQRQPFIAKGIQRGEMDSDPQGSGGLLDSSADEIGGFRVGGQISRSEAFISDPMNDRKDGKIQVWLILILILIPINGRGVNGQ
jgi:hypothetical protein